MNFDFIVCLVTGRNCLSIKFIWAEEKKMRNVYTKVRNEPFTIFNDLPSNVLWT